MVGRRPLGDGDAAERDHAGRGDRPGLRRRHALRAVLLRAADRDDHPQRDARAVLLPRPRLHRLRVSRAPLRSEDTDPGERAVPLLARVVVRRDHCRARRDSLDHPRLEPDADHPRHRPAHGDLHDGRRRPGGDLDRRQADGGHRRRPARGRHRARPRAAVRGERRRCAARGRRRGALDCRRLPLRLDADLHLLVRAARRAVPDAVVFRLRPEPGAALPDREVRRGRARLADDERLRQDPAAGARPADRRARLRLLPLSAAAAVVQQGARGTGGKERESGGVPPAGRRVHGGLRGTPRGRRHARRGS